jgi:hypothetical protein
MTHIKEVLTPPEREIVITKTDMDDRFSVYVASPTWLRRLERRGWTPTAVDRFGAWFELPEYFFSIRSSSAVENRRTGNPASLRDAREARHLAASTQAKASTNATPDEAVGDPTTDLPEDIPLQSRRPK